MSSSVASSSSSAAASAVSAAGRSTFRARSAIRRLPLPRAIESLRSGEGAQPLPPSVKSISFKFVSKNAPSGPRDFVRAIAPRIAFANPTIPFLIERIRDPRGVEKGRVLDPKAPDVGVSWEGGVMPEAEMKVEIEGKTQPTLISISNTFTGSQILDALRIAAGVKDV